MRLKLLFKSSRGSQYHEEYPKVTARLAEDCRQDGEGYSEVTAIIAEDSG